MQARDIIVEELQKDLPKADLPFNVFYWRSKGTRCRPLVYRGSYKKTPQNKTDPMSTDTLTTHFVVLAYDGVIVYAIEIMVYDTPELLQTIFISKADTTGHYTLDSSMNQIKRPRLSYGKVTNGILRGLLRCFIDPLRPVRLCLFARAEKQYLFPLSSECQSKHVLTGSQLLRWWIKVIVDTLQHSDGLVSRVGRARLQIPGSETSRIRSFFSSKSSLDCPAQSQTTTQQRQPVVIDWKVGDVFWPDNDANLAAVQCVPRFSDDPLTRFLDFLVTDNRAKSTDQKRFWVELEAQQEFRLSIEVGVIGVEFQIDHQRSVYQELKDNKDNSVAALTSAEFNRLREFIMTLDYSTLDMNKEAMETLTRRNPKLEIFGSLEEVSREEVQTEEPSVVNVLNVGLIKRKKPMTDVEPTVNTLDMSLIKRKKPAPVEPVVNVLDTSLVRKKPKK